MDPGISIRVGAGLLKCLLLQSGLITALEVMINFASPPRVRTRSGYGRECFKLVCFIEYLGTYSRPGVGLSSDEISPQFPPL